MTIWVLLLITANQKLKQMVADQQEAEKRKTMSQEIHKELQIQQVKISEKTAEVMEDLSKVEPAVREAQQGIHIITLTVIPLPTVCSPPLIRTVSHFPTQPLHHPSTPSSPSL